MRFVLLAFVLVLAGCQRAPVQEKLRGYVRHESVRPFPEATKVRVFVESGYDEKTDRGIVEKDAVGRALTPEERRAFESQLSIQTPVNLSPDDDFFMIAACFMPHHFVRYYDASKRQIGEIAICFCCSGVQMTPDNRMKLQKDQRFEANYMNSEKLFKSWGVPNRRGLLLRNGEPSRE